MIRVPDFVTEEMIEKVKETVKEKKDIKEADSIELETFSEGLSAQIMHVGPYAEEEPIAKKLHDFIEEQGYNLSGPHNEIYMSDPRRVPPERLKTILRQPIEKP
jgi:hypothetical protein